MCGNRVEELEARVNELEASVEGLTDELVECKVRLRELENAVDEDIGFAAEGDAGEAVEETDTQPTGEAAVADSTKQAGSNDENNREESEAESDSDIIVA